MGARSGAGVEMIDVSVTRGEQLAVCAEHAHDVTGVQAAHRGAPGGHVPVGKADRVGMAVNPGVEELAVNGYPGLPAGPTGELDRYDSPSCLRIEGVQRAVAPREQTVAELEQVDRGIGAAADRNGPDRSDPVGELDPVGIVVHSDVQE